MRNFQHYILLSGLSRPGRILSALVVCIFWYAYSRAIIAFWGYSALYNPLLHWAIDELIPSHPMLFSIVIYVHDALLNILLAIPAGYLLRKVCQANLWIPVCVAACLVFLWDYRLVIFGDSSIIEFFSSDGVLTGTLTALGLLPLAYYITGSVKLRDAN